MNLAARALKIYVPKRIRREKLNTLFEATARAFDADMPALDDFTFKECLEKYALFTRDEAGKRLQSGDDLREIRKALYLSAYALGKEIRDRLHLDSRRDVLSIGRVLYRTIGIDFKGSTGGAVSISSCIFSRFFSAAVCRIMSSLDEGIAAGLSAGGELTFSQRITDGKPCCNAFLEFTNDAG